MTSEASYRTRFRRVTIEVELTGDPVIYQYADDGHRMLVQTVTIHFDHADDGSVVSAWLQGLRVFRSGKPGNTREYQVVGGVFESWPTWLQALAREHEPERYVEHRGPIR